MESITQLKKKNEPFVWKDDQDKSFVTIKARITDATLLAYPDLNKLFVIYPDASNK